jgi:isoleucyl-tRNA synthetase
MILLVSLCGSSLFLVLIVTRDLPSVTVAFPLVDDPKTSLLAWTTTPWTLPSNLALCVHPDYNYIKIHDQDRDENYILHENLLKTLYKDPKKAKYKKVGQFKGSDMGGWRYVPLFEYFTEEVIKFMWCFTMLLTSMISTKTKLSGFLLIPT